MMNPPTAALHAPHREYLRPISPSDSLGPAASPSGRMAQSTAFEKQVYDEEVFSDVRSGERLESEGGAKAEQRLLNRMRTVRVATQRSFR